MLTLDGIEINENELSEKSQICLQQIQRIKLKKQDAQIDIANLNILEEHYVKILREEVEIIKEVKEEIKEEIKE
jgi:hypothetical protein